MPPIRPRPPLDRLLPALLAAVLGGGAAGAAIGVLLDGNDSSPDSTSPTVATTTASPASRSPASEALTPREIYRDDAPGVVVITDTQTHVVPPTFFTPSQKERVGALGSGFVIDDRGDIVTNDHVVARASSIRVGFSGGGSYPAKIVGADPSSDLAVVRVTAPASALHPLVFGDSGSIGVGDAAYAIGNPFGLDRTMTAGIVSAVGRDIRSPNGFTIPNAIQTDASINHGNSGGPLLDRFGHVIGVNAQIEGGTVDGNVGIGFAIPGTTARSVAMQLLSSGHAEHPWLGVEIEPIDPAKDYKFVLSTRTVAHGRVRFVITNRGSAPHDFSIANHTSKTIQPGQRTSMTITLKRGRYAYRCTVDSHTELGMKGVLRVS
jgi:S1-C subfamily serine protease